MKNENMKIEVLGDSILKGIQINTENQIQDDFGIDVLKDKYNMEITNDSRFGCTVTKGMKILQKKIQMGLSCDAVVMDFGGNDCDYKWSEIAQNPEADFCCNTPMETFQSEYRKMIDILRNRGTLPILTTLPPLDSKKFFDWWCKDLDKENVMKWLGSIDCIYQHQEAYSKEVEFIAKEEHVPLIDLRSAFLSHENVADLLCEDGTHSNSKGQKIMTEEFDRFAGSYDYAQTIGLSGRKLS